MPIRHFTWKDLPALLNLINLVRGAEGDERTMELPFLRQWLSQPGLSPERNCFLSEREGELVAYTILYPELRIGRAVVEIGVHPFHHKQWDIERCIIQKAVARSKELGANVAHIPLPPLEFWRDLLREEGFFLVKRYWIMRWQGERLPSVGAEPAMSLSKGLALPLPKEFSIRSFQEEDIERLTMMQNAAFGGSWGFCPNTVEEIEYRVSMSICHPKGIVFLMHGDKTVGYCWTYIMGSSIHPIGIIGMIGIDPSYRGRGLSRTVLLAGMEYPCSRGVKYIQLNVDEENEAAINLYNSVGFKKAMEFHWFETRLS